MPTNLNNYFTKEASLASPVIQAAKPLGRMLLGSLGTFLKQMFFTGSGLKYTAGKLSKLAPGGKYSDTTGKLIRFNQQAIPENAGFYETAKRSIGNFAGNSYNRFNNSGKALARYYTSAARDFNNAVGSQTAAQNVTKALKRLGWAGVGGEIGEMFVDENSPTGKTLHTINSANPFYWASKAVATPFMEATPTGLALNGAGKLLEVHINGLAEAGKQGALTAIDQTANQLGNLSFADRLGFLFAPGSAANRYRQQGFDAVARHMAELKGTGDNLKDKAISDINKTVY